MLRRARRVETISIRQGVAPETTVSLAGPDKLLAILYFPPPQEFLGTDPVDWHIYLLAWLGIPLIFGLDVVRKQVVRNHAANLD